MNKSSRSGFRLPSFSVANENVQSDQVISRVSSLDNNSTKVKIYSICNVNNAMYIGGFFSSVNGVKKNNIVKLTNTGEIDNDFNGSIEGSVYKIISEDDNILIAGSFGAYNNKIVHSIVEVDMNGILNEKFNPFKEYMLAKINDIAVLPSSKIMIAGTFIKESGNEDENSTMKEIIHKTSTIVILNKDGSVDKTYSEKFSNIKNEVFAIDIYDDKIYLGGDFEFIHENRFYNNLVSYSLDGELNKLFQIGKLSGIIFDVKAELNRVVYAGDFIMEDSLQTRSFYISDLLGQTININNFSVDSDIYSIEIYDGNLVLTGDGKFSLNNKAYSNNISLQLDN